MTTASTGAYYTIILPKLYDRPALVRGDNLSLSITHVSIEFSESRKKSTPVATEMPLFEGEVENDVY